MSSPITTAVAAPAAAPIAGPLSEPCGVRPGLVSVAWPAFVDGRCDAGTVVGWGRVGVFGVFGEVGFESEFVVVGCVCVVPTVGCKPVGFCVCVVPTVGGGGIVVPLGIIVLCGVNGVGRELDVGCEGAFFLTGVDWESLFGGVSFCEEGICARAESTRKASVTSHATRSLRL